MSDEIDVLSPIQEVAGKPPVFDADIAVLVGGIAAKRQIVTVGLSTRLLVLTTFDADQHVFLLKNAPTEQLSPPCAPSPPATRCCAPHSPGRLVERHTAPATGFTPSRSTARPPRT